jgi:NhaA family Na+:H+ antiporter
LPGGVLNPLHRAVNPLLGTLGGVLGPIAVYFSWVAISGDESIRDGWGIPTATDIALAWLVARMAFGAAHPAVSYLLLLAVADDGVGLAIIAMFYPDPMHPVQPMFLLLVALAMLLAHALRRRGTLNFWAYLLGPGVLSWLGLFYAHLHPALALVPIVPFMPSKGFDLGMFAEEDSGVEYADTLDRFAHTFRSFVTFGLFAFGLVNAGVVFSSFGNATWGVLLALVLGKTCGVFVFAAIGDKFGLPLPKGMDHRSLFVAGLTAALGLTVALFVAGVAFTDPSLQGAAKMGALLSGGMSVVVLLASRVLGIVRVDSTPSV